MPSGQKVGKIILFNLILTRGPYGKKKKNPAIHTFNDIKVKINE